MPGQSDVYWLDLGGIRRWHRHTAASVLQSAASSFCHGSFCLQEASLLAVLFLHSFIFFISSLFCNFFLFPSFTLNNIFAYLFNGFPTISISLNREQRSWNNVHGECPARIIDWSLHNYGKMVKCCLFVRFTQEILVCFGIYRWLNNCKQNNLHSTTI